MVLQRGHFANAVHSLVVTGYAVICFLKNHLFL